MKDKIAGFLRERAGLGTPRPRMLEGGVSFAYVFGAVLVMLIGVEMITGLALSAFYSPSSTDAWASVAYIQDQATWGWLVRGLHHHGGSAIVIVAGLHLVQTAVAGAYKRPRELVWWLGVLLLVLMLAWAVTGYVLRWDQAGYWANQVEVGIAAGTPVIGEKIRALAIGGNDYGNLTLTRFHMLHVVLMPAIVVTTVVAHVALARRHGTTAVRSGTAVPRWPRQSLLDVAAMIVVFTLLLAYVVDQHGVDLAGPADPTSRYDARPLWYFRWLYALRTITGSFEQLAAMAAPAVVGGFLMALPLLDRSPDRAVKMRTLWLGALAGLLALIGGLTVMSFTTDSRDAKYLEARDKQAEVAQKARALARDNGVPVTGPADLWKTAPMWLGRTLFAKACASCHDEASKERKGPVIGPGHGDRAWLTAFLKQPSGDRYWGKTKHAKTEAAMKPVEVSPEDLADLVELLYSESGATDVAAAKRDHGAKLFETCSDCHSREAGVAGTAAPDLAGLGTRDYFTSFISNPKSAIHMGTEKSEMPRFDKEMTIVERDAIAGYLVWLRTATKADLDALGSL